MPMPDPLIKSKFGSLSRDSLCSFCSWLFCVACGFGYVAMVLCGRSQPFESGDNPLGDFLLLVGICAVLFLLGPIQNIRFVKLESGKSPVAMAAVFLLIFFSALHWEFVGDLLGAKFSLKPSHLSNLDSKMVGVLIAEVIGVSLVVGYHAWQAKQATIHVVYFSAFALIVIVLGVITAVLRDTHYLHVHHYCIGLVFFPFCRFRTFISVACQGFFLGMAVEGVSRWGMDPVWYAVKSM